MSRKQATALTVALAAVFLIGVNVLPSAAQQPPPPIAVEALTGRAEFTDDVDLRFKVRREGERTLRVRVDDPSRTVVARITLQPGARFPWHTHTGPVIVNVVEGELGFIEADACVARAYPAGTALIDSGFRVHTAFNSTDQVTVVVGTFLAAPEEGSLFIPAENQEPDCPSPV